MVKCGQVWSCMLSSPLDSCFHSTPQGINSVGHLTPCILRGAWERRRTFLCLPLLTAVVTNAAAALESRRALCLISSRCATGFGVDFAFESELECCAGLCSRGPRRRVCPQHQQPRRWGDQRAAHNQRRGAWTRQPAADVATSMERQGEVECGVWWGGGTR